MGKEKKKLFLFREYRKNLELIAENPYYNKDVLKDIVVCPICCAIFKESDVEKKDDGSNYLTIEHVPPKYLGGTIEVLTCHKCNNKFSKEDNHLQYLSDTPNQLRRPMKLKSEELRLSAITTFDLDKNEVQFSVSSKEDLSTFVVSVNENKTFHVEFIDNTPALGANLLKIAYLLAFRKFGYGLILHGSYNCIRNQINKPYEQSLKNYGSIRMRSNEQLPLGVFLVKEPKELSSVLVRFQTVKKGEDMSDKKQIYTFHLPSPMSDVAEFYNMVHKQAGKALTYKVSPFDDVDYWHDRNHVFGAIDDIDKCQ